MRLIREEPRFPYAVLTPSRGGFMSGEQEKLVFCVADTVIVLEQKGSSLTSTRFCIQDVSYVQVGRALLQSWVKIRGIACNGAPSSCEFEFNTISDYLFTPIVEKLRAASACSSWLDASEERSKFDYLNRLNFKLMSFARHSILPGEKIAQIIFQPEIRTQTLNPLAKLFCRMLCTPHLCILTDKELILVQDGVGKRWGRDVRYGGTWNYIPLDKITSVSCVEAQTGLLTMSIQLPGDDPIDSLFSASNRQDVILLKNRIGGTR